MRILLTGSSGRLGSAIAAQLAGRHSILGLDLSPGPYTTEIGSVADRAVVTRLVSGADAVIHTASLHAPHVERLSKEQFVDVNIKGTLYLLEAATQFGLRRLIYTSTTSVYGRAMVPQGNRAVWVDETLVPQPRDIYDITKLAAEQLCAQFAQEFALRTVCLRTSRFWNEPLYRQTVYRLYRGVDVRDAARAHDLALEREEVTGVFNISAQSPFRPEDAAELLTNAPVVISRCCPQAAAYFFARGWELPASIDRVYDISAARADLGYAPRHNFGELLREG